MIGKPEWFTPRKFGWGLGLGTKESVAYVIGIAFAVWMALAAKFPLGTRIAVAGAVVALAVLDVIHIMMGVYARLDERERRHQALAERNASFVAVACLVSYIGFVALTSYPAAPLLDRIAAPIAILLAMSLAKGGTLIYLERRG